MMMNAGCLNPAEPDYFQGEDINPVQQYRTFELQDHNDSRFNSTTLDGNIVVFGFIYVNCPDVCPTTTSDMKWLESQLSENERSNVSFITITVDPWRDGPIALTEYMELYNVTWPHLTTTVETEVNLSLIEQVWTDFSIGVVLTEANSSTSLGRGHTVYYDVQHTDGLVLVDEYGYQRVRWTHDNWNSEGILNDLRSMMN
jgi:protein SCO1/2